MKTFLKIIGVIAGMAVIGVGLTYGMLHYLNNSKPAAKKASPAAPAVEVLADSNVKAEDAKLLENGNYSLPNSGFNKILNGQMRTYRQHYMKWHIKKRKLIKSGAIFLLHKSGLKA